ncbi:MAG: hypothetical protein JST55_15215 [Bacteroidetes bacterium]|nr:hypothetical protein [Bacteroidota bacterium]
MNDTLTIVEILFFASMIVLAVYLIMSLKKITNSVSNIEKEIIEVSDGLTPLISETSVVVKEASEVVKDLSVISENIKVDYAKARPAITNVITKAEDIAGILGKIKDGTTTVAKSIFPALAGVSTALKFLKR